MKEKNNTPPVRKPIIKSMLRKEFKQILRDVKMRGVLFGAPVMMLLLFGYAMNTDVTRITMAILDQDRTGMSRSFIEGFTGSGYFDPIVFVEADQDADVLLDKGRADMFLHIKKGFARSVKDGSGTEVQIIIDGTDSTRAAVIANYVTVLSGEFSYDYLKDRMQTMILTRGAGGLVFKKNIDLRERALFNPELASRNFFLPGILVLLIALVTIMLTSMSVVKEREVGTMEQIIVSPLKPFEFILGKTLPFGIIGFIDIFVISFIMIFWFNVPFRGSFAFLLLSSIFYLASTLAIGLYISTISKTQQQAMLSAFLFFLPSILFSGFFFPIYAMPEPIQYITLLNPLRYFVTIVRGVFLKGVGPLVLWKEIFALAGLGLTFFILSARRFSRRME